MRRLVGMVLSLGIVAALVTPAAAQGTKAPGKFEDLADKAVHLGSPRIFAGLLWSYVATCDEQAGSMARRQCEGLRKARQAQLTGKTFLIAAEPGAFSVGDWDEKKAVAPVMLSACVACTAGLPIDGRQLFVVGGATAPAIANGTVRAAALHESGRPFKDVAAHAHFKNDVVPRLRTELVVRVADGKVWTKGEVSGFNVEVLGFRTYDPCDGSVVVALPESSPGTADKQACSGEPVVEVPVVPTPEVVAPPPPKPAKLTTAQIQGALRPATEAAALCYDAYGVAGQANVHITIDSDGNVVGVEQEGDFVGLPTGACIEKAVRAVKFPETAKKRTTVAFPFILR